MAKKKVYDILPPNVANKLENTIKSIDEGEKKKKEKINYKKPVVSVDKKRRFPLWEIFVGGFVIIILICVYFYNTLPEVNIQIWPKLETLTLQESITADKLVGEVDLQKKVIPAKYIEIQKDGSQEFPATGSASNDGKALGVIRVYNKVNPSTPLVLKTGTHFLSDSGKYFVTLEKITIPGMQKGAAGFIDVKVQAEESGTEYNIKPSKFSVPKLSGTLYYYGIFGESNSDMKGGYTGNVKKVTKSDISNAKDVLTKSLLSQARSSLGDNFSFEYIILDEAILDNIISFNSSAKEGTVADNFTESATVKVLAIGFKKQDADKFVNDGIFSQLQNNRKILEKSVDNKYSANSADIKGGKLVLSINSTSKNYQSVDLNSIIDLLPKKSADKIGAIFEEKFGSNISELKVNFWPFWVKTAPNNKNRIKVDLNFE